MRGVVVHDDVHLQGFRHVFLDLSEEVQIFLMSVTLSALRQHFALGRVQRGKQGGGAMPSVVVGHTLDIAKSHRQQRLGAFQRLNLTLFIHTQNYCIFRRIQVQPYNIPYFFYKKWIRRELEMFLTVGL